MTMHAVQLVEVGKPLALREIERPEPSAGEIRVRVRAAGICHSDAHYRVGTSGVGFLPITLGHEIAGEVDAIGPAVEGVSVGDRVAVHYLFSCGQCAWCQRGLEQFCPKGRMVGKQANGGYAEYAIAPARNAIPVAANVSFEAAAIMMCSSSTAYHSLRKARVAPGERVAVFGAGGLGMSAVQLARACGAAEVFAVDVDAAKLRAAETYGARSVNAAQGPAEVQLMDLTGGQGVDVALEFTGVPAVQSQAVAALAVQGRLALAGIAKEPFAVTSYPTVIGREIEIVGVSDHLRHELVTLMGFAERGVLDLESVIADRIPLDAAQINARLDALAAFKGHTRSVILPHGT